MKQVFPLLLICLFLSACSEKVTHHHTILAFGTTIEISINHDNKALVEQAFEQLEKDFQKMHEIWHPWQDNALKRTNQLLRTGEWFTASTSILPLIETAKHLSIRSNHYFNPTIGKLVELWGFHRDNPETSFAPDMPRIRQLQQNMPNMQNIEFEGIRMRGTHADIQFDSGGIAKGYAIDLAIQTLKSLGLENAIINAGGDLSVIGKQDNQPWHIGIQHPRKQQVLASINTRANESIFTSGDYQRFYTLDGKRIQHILDPVTGSPVSHTHAATVIHSDPTVADAAATALMAAGESNWKKVAEGLGIKQVLLLTADNKLLISKPMRERITLHHTDDLKVEVHEL